MNHLTADCRSPRRRWLPAALGLVGGVAAAGPVTVGQPVFDPPGSVFDGFKKDEIVGDFVFGSYASAASVRAACSILGRSSWV